MLFVTLSSFAARELNEMKKNLRNAALLTAILANAPCVGNAQEDFAPDPIVQRAGGLLVFNRHCADREPYIVQAYALMDSGDGRARALVSAAAGYRPGPESAIVAGVILQALELQAGSDWGETSYSLQLRAQAGDATAESPEAAQYHGDGPGGGPLPPRFTTNPQGASHWITFVEPGEDTADSDRAYRIPPTLEVLTESLGVQGPNPRIALTLIVNNLAGGEQIHLRGPSIRVPERIWRMRPPTPKRLGLAATLNPFQEGGLWDVLRRGSRYRGCIKERRTAKRVFAGG